MQLHQQCNDQAMRLRFRSPTLDSTVFPPEITGNVTGTWAGDTMSRRIPYNIVPRIREDNQQILREDPSIFYSFTALVEDLSRGREGFLRDLEDGAEDCGLWSRLLASIPAERRNWLDAPWLISEYYFYRRVVESFRYFESSYDMFKLQKFAGLRDALSVLGEIATSLEQQMGLTANERALMQIGIYMSLWGNKLDLSLWPKHGNHGESNKVGSGGQIATFPHFDGMRSFILDDDSDELIDYLMQSSNSDRIDIVVDNAGYELISDLILAFIFLHMEVAQKVRLHTKGHPTFVSDATSQDCEETILFLNHESDPNTPLRWLAKCLSDYHSSGKIEFVDDCFWCQPVPLWDMPANIEDRLSGSRLVVVKGDANYRRLLGDRQWDFAISAKDVLSYWPWPVSALRTFKSEIGCGIEPEKQLSAKCQDSFWQTSGQWAVVQFYQGPC